ncbi:O-antigen ligase [Bradyrhizobium lablabi]|uniref:O-antigen ligase n=1 Tax=Bradyrhizobium lablabi TaxID=722472 RepID=A0A1M7BE75_9BRAD|nr:O-antigen ligase family protein [Bradyrhizobium lablabi]SHL52909.1 O-antigen ligase [Bradyrhizobium lablabi]
MTTDSPRQFLYFTKDEKGPLAGVTAAVVTTAAFAKMFLPFYFIGSTGIFAVASVLGVTLIAIGWRPLYDMATKVPDILLLLALFYGLVIANFLFYSRPAVPTTHLLGILIFHGLFIIFGFAAARALRPVLVMLLGAGAIFSVVLVQHIIRFGVLMQDGYLRDIFGVGDRIIYIAFQQEIGIMLGLAALAALGLSSNRAWRILSICALPVVLVVLVHISARGALIAFVCSLIFLASAAIWVRSKKLAVFGIIAVVAVGTVASGLFYERALHDRDIDGVAADAISRTIREIHNPTPGLRLEIWSQAWHRIIAEPNRLLFGRGIGIYPVDEGYGPPDWPLHRTIASRVYPHNVHLEMLYEAGIAGLLLFSVLTLSPLVISLRHWPSLTLAQKAAVSMYVFHIAGSEFSGAFAIAYLDQFFFALTVGIIALRRMDDALAPGLTPSREKLDPRHGAQVLS